MNKIHIHLALLLNYTLLTGCQPLKATSQFATTTRPVSTTAMKDVGADATITPFKTPMSFVTQYPEVTPSFEPSMDAIIQQAKNDLAQKSGLSPDKIIVLEVEAVEWSDSSLGCPQPDMFYLQVITPGYRILLEANAQVYEYHSNRDTYIIYCENPNPLIYPPKP